VPEHLQGTHSVASASLPVRPLLPAAPAAGSRPASSAFYPALRFRRRVDATWMVFPLIKNDLLASFRKIAFCQLLGMVSIISISYYTNVIHFHEITVRDLSCANRMP
jgi:hypothetical protein